MLRPRLSVVLGLAALPGAVACLNTLFPFAPDQLFETNVRATCAFVFRCCEASERDATDISAGAFRNEDECVEESLEEGSQQALTGQRAKAVVDAGNGVYDAELAESCLRPLHDAAYACDAQTFLLTSLSAECGAYASRGFVRGSIADGDDCTDDIECADEGVCVREERENNGEIVLSLAGVCRAAGGAGESCQVDGEFRACQAGLRCSFDGADAFTCEAIEQLADGEDCSDDDECVSGNCAEVEAGSCSDSGDPCVLDTDCDEPNGEFCEIDFRDICVGVSDVDVEICDGK